MLKAHVIIIFHAIFFMKLVYTGYLEDHYLSFKVRSCTDSFVVTEIHLCGVSLSQHKVHTSLVNPQGGASLIDLQLARIGWWE